MLPHFRSDLKCSREEQQGVVFYRIDDPKTQANFRLYEIEYRIALKLDGKRTMAEVIAAVKADDNFDISEDDLSKFVGQLESMGFVHAGPAPASGGDAVEAVEDLQLIEVDDSEQDTAVMNIRHLPEIELLDEADAGKAIDEAELTRLLKSALLHIKQGYVVHARDYILAARELDPQDQRLSQMVAHLEILDDSTSERDVVQVWQQAESFFPDIAAEVGPLVTGGEPTGVAESAMRVTDAWDDDLRTRVIYFVAIIVLVLGGGAFVLWAMKHGRFFESVPEVRLEALSSVPPVPVYFEATPKVQPAKQETLVFDAGGKILQVLVEPGQRVAQGDIVARLQFKGPLEGQYKKAQVALKKAQGEFAKANERLEKLLAVRAGIEADQQEAQERLRELSPKSVLRQGGVSKRDVAKWTKIKARANKQLSTHAKKERQPRAQARKAKAVLDKAEKQMAVLEKRIAPMLVRAPFSGVINAVHVRPGDNVSPKTKVVTLKDDQSVLLSFTVENAGPMQPGGEAHVSVAGGVPSRARVTQVERGDSHLIRVKLNDPTGGYSDMEPSSFRLVREFVDPAFAIPRTTIVKEGDNVFLIVAVQGKALKRRVAIIESVGSQAIVRDLSGTLRSGQLLVTERADGGVVSEIADGSSLETAR